MLKARHTLPLLVALGAFAVTTPAAAESIIKQPGDHPDYHVEIEPHGVLGLNYYWNWDYYGPFGFGGGARFSIPVCKNCFVPKINNNVAISFGADIVFWPFATQFINYVPTYLYLPVAMQWNFFLTKKWSVGPELGFVPEFGVFYDYNACGLAAGCHNWGVFPAFWAVARFHFNDSVALTMRLGFPEFFNIGVSFFL